MQIDSFVISNTAGPLRSAVQHDGYGYGDGKATFMCAVKKLSSLRLSTAPVTAQLQQLSLLNNATSNFSGPILPILSLSVQILLEPN